MSIVSTIYPDPRESARCLRSPLPRRSLEPWDVVDDRCDPSVFELTRLEPLRKAPAKADSRRSGFGFEPVSGAATLSPFPVESAFQFSTLEVVTRHVGRRVDLAWFRNSK